MALQKQSITLSMRNNKPTMTIQSQNVHIRDNKKYEGYHRVVASLADKYSPLNAHILDIGCGMGNVVQLINDNRPDINISVADPYENCLEKTKQRVDSVTTFKIEPNEINESILGNGYDTIIMCHSLEHMRCPADAIEQALSLLKENGSLILAVPNPVRPEVILGNITKQHYVNKGHLYTWDRSHWMNFLEEILKLHVLEYESDMVYIFGKLRGVKLLSGLIYATEMKLGKILPWFSFSNIAVIKKI